MTSTASGGALTKGFWGWVRTGLLFIGRSILFILGCVSLIVIFEVMFEQELSVWELSAIELLFSALLVFGWAHLIRVARSKAINIRTMIYIPIRNVGWFSLLSLLLFIFLGLNNVKVENLAMFSAENQQYLQLTSFIVLLLCVACAYPKTKPVKPAIAQHDITAEAGETVKQEGSATW